MADLIIPPWMRVSGGRFDIVSNTAAASSIFTGAVRTLARTGDRVKTMIRIDNASSRESAPVRALARAIRAGMRGQANRIWFTDPSYTRRGSFPTSELLTNNTFASGTTGWTGDGATLTVADRTLRATYVNATSACGFTRSGISVTQYAPHVLRAAFSSFRGAVSTGVAQLVTTGITATGSVSGVGMATATIVPETTTVLAEPYFSRSGSVYGDYMECPYISLARCALADNGPNLLQRSNEIDNAYWTKLNCTVDTNNAVAPDNTTTADLLRETAVNAGHQVSSTAVTVSSSAADYAFTVCVAPSSRTWCFIEMDESSGGTSAVAYFNLSTGAVGSSGVNAGWANIRTFSKSLGNGWYALSIVARKTSAATSVTGVVGIATGNSAPSYLGTAGLAAIAISDATLAQSSVPTRPVRTSSASTTGTTQSGLGIYLKGLPASTSGLLLPGDWVQIGKQLCIVAASLDSDSMGWGYLLLGYPIRTATSDNDPVIIHEPFGRFIATSNEGGWDESPGGFSNFEFELIEALDS